MDSDISAFALHKICDYVRRTTGIVIGADKTALATSRLWRRLEITGHPSYESCFTFLSGDAGEQERQMLLDLLTTNHTYLFRERAHFYVLRDDMIPRHSAWLKI